MKKKIIIQETLPTDTNTAPTTEEVTEAGRKFIGIQIADHRRQLGMTQRDLAARCSLSQSVIARIERGQHSTGIDLLNRIAVALDCEVIIKKMKR